MATMLLTLLAMMFLALHPEMVKPDSVTLAVFEPGPFPTTAKQVPFNKSDPDSPPKSMYIISPAQEGQYSVLLFFRGTCIPNSAYGNIFNHISSYGYIVVAPLLYSNCILGKIPTMSGSEEVENAAKVANWLPKGLDSQLPADVRGNYEQIAVSGHSRGGKTAFALALRRSNISLQVTISLLVGVDPVAGLNRDFRTSPEILTYVHDSLDLGIPVTILGSGFGSKFPACAPNEVNHEEFVYETKPPVGYFVYADYGHMDILDDNMSAEPCRIGKACCEHIFCIVSKPGCRDLVRRTVSGIIVSFLNAYFRYDPEDYLTIASSQQVAPATLDPAWFLNQTHAALKAGLLYNLQFNPFCPLD